MSRESQLHVTRHCLDASPASARAVADDLADLCDLWRLLAIAAVESAIANVVAHGNSTLAANSIGTRECTARELVQSHHSIHLWLTELADNDRLGEALGSTLNELGPHLLRYLTGSEEARSELESYIRDIVAAIGGGAPHAAANTVLEHIRLVRSTVTAELISDMPLEEL